MRLAFVFAGAIILVGMLFDTLKPRCQPASHHGTAVAFGLRLGSCP